MITWNMDLVVGNASGLIKLKNWDRSNGWRVAKSIKRVFEVSMQMKHPIDQFHYEIMANITEEGGSISAEPLIDIPHENE